MRDWGKEKNLQVYNSETPPDFNMSNIKVPIKLYYVEDDIFLTKEVKINLKQENQNLPFDLQSFKQMLEIIPNIKSIYEVKRPFRHGNFIVATGVEKNLSANIIATLGLKTL